MIELNDFIELNICKKKMYLVLYVVFELVLIGNFILLRDFKILLNFIF